MKDEKWIALLLALIVAGIVADKQAPGSAAGPPAAPHTVVTSPQPTAATSGSPR